ncbi:MAG: hypothetical protein ABSA02_37635 [Trebonia sp.]
MSAAGGVTVPIRLGPVKLGLARGGIELRQTLTYWPDLVQALFFSGASIFVLFLMRGHHVPGTTFSLGSLTPPSVIGMNFAVSPTCPAGCRPSDRCSRSTGSGSACADALGVHYPAKPRKSR